MPASAVPVLPLPMLCSIIQAGEVLSAEVLSAEVLSAEVLSAEVLSAEVLSAEVLSAEVLSAQSLIRTSHLLELKPPVTVFVLGLLLPICPAPLSPSAYLRFYQTNFRMSRKICQTYKIFHIDSLIVTNLNPTLR